MMRRVRTLIDIDGVLGNFKSLYVECCNQANGTSFTVEDAGNAWDLAKTLKLTTQQQNATWNLIKEPRRAFCMSLLPDAKAILKLDGCDVYFLTSPVPSPTWVHDRNEWLALHFGPMIAQRVIYTSHKELVAGHIFIDDKPNAVIDWCDAQAVYFTQAFHGVMWTDNMREVKKAKDSSHYTDAEFDGDIMVTKSWDEVKKLGKQMSMHLNKP